MLCPFNKFNDCVEKSCPFFYKGVVDKTDQCHRSQEIIERREIYKILKKHLPSLKWQQSMLYFSNV